MTYASSQEYLPFVSELRAKGHGEVWDHTDEITKLQQFGGRCTDTESSYNHKYSGIGNWNEQRFDINRIFEKNQNPPTKNSHFETTYGTGYHAVDRSKVPEALQHLEAREPIAFPGHQPELDPKVLKKQYNSFVTTSRAAFGDPTSQK
ncbi:LOW QUALITY PROTEIN: cilia- and flagella-associated protein 68 [Pocillopora verrucosa]|uniref:LOW QUALITY PROTEIN: cilia- and flagella-associated protein 68 n=1 Tax=Pocillopora verrucosa TaxID=203993 RepID=UPI00334247A5